MPNENAWGPPDLRDRPEDAAIDRAAKELLVSDPELNEMVRKGQRGKAFRRALGMIVAQRCARAPDETLFIAAQRKAGIGLSAGEERGALRYLRTTPGDTLPLA